MTSLTFTSPSKSQSFLHNAVLARLSEEINNHGVYTLSIGKVSDTTPGNLGEIRPDVETL